jgi:hypothetical protein
MGRACSSRGSIGTYRILAGKTQGKRPLGRNRRRWEEDVKMDLRVWWYGLNSSVSGQKQVEGSCEHGNKPSGSIKCWEILEWLRG